MLAHELKRSLAARSIHPFAATRADCDITDKSQVARLFQTHRPTLVLNCAAHTAVDQCEDEPDRANSLNGTAVGYLAEFSREYSAKLIHFSTDFVFDGHSVTPYRPNDPPNPLSKYGHSKLLGELAIREIAPPAWLTIRTSWLFGRHGNCFPKIILDRARAGHALKVVNDQVGCPTYAVDLATAVFDLVDRQACGIWHITNDSPTSWYDFATAIVKEFSVPAEVTPISTAQWVAMRPKQARRPFFSVLDISQFFALTGRKMRPWYETLGDYRTECEKSS